MQNRSSGSRICTNGASGRRHSGKSNKDRKALPGMAAIHEAFKPARSLLIGDGGIALEEFLLKPASAVLA